MTVSELIEELSRCDASAIVCNADGSEFDEVDEEGGEVTIFCEDDPEDDEPTEGNVIDAEFTAVK